MIEALSKPGRDPRSDLPLPIFRKDVVKFEDLAVGMELRGTVLNVVDFGEFVDVGLSDSGLVHVSQLSAGFVRSPHDVVAVGQQVRALGCVDRQRPPPRGLTMIEPGTEKERPQRERKPRRKPRQEQVPVAAAAEANAAPPRQRTDRPQRGERPRSGGPKHRNDRDRDRRPPQRTGTYEKRTAKSQKPITKEMEEGKEYMPTFRRPATIR